MSTINFHNVDCMEFMKTIPDKYYELSIVDPPYGINIKNNMGRRKGDKPSGHKKVKWDSSIPSEEYFNELFRISKNQIIWGANYFNMPPTKCFIIWEKPQISEKMSFSMCEYAWASFNSTSKIYKYCNTNEKIHPTEKPIDLYRWLLQNYAKQGDKIFDSHGGSMSIAIASDMEGYDLDICELDKEYFDAAVQRFNMYKSQLTLF